jgi:hypothetical protein
VGACSTPAVQPLACMQTSAAEPGAPRLLIYSAEGVEVWLAVHTHVRGADVQKSRAAISPALLGLLRPAKERPHLGAEQQTLVCVCVCVCM